MSKPLRLLALLPLVLVAHAAAADPPKQPARLDAHGDPLPAGALHRFGTLRFCYGLPIRAATLSSDGKTFALASDLDTIHLLDASSGKEIRRFRNTAGRLSWLGFSPDGKILAGADSSGEVTLWDAATGKELRQLKAGRQGGSSFFFTFSTNGKYLAASSERFRGKAAAWVWEVATGKRAASVEPVHNRRLCVALSGDGKVLATTGRYDNSSDRSGAEEKNRIIQLWNVAAGKELRKIEAEGSSNLGGLAFSPDGKRLAVVSDWSQVLLWDVPTGKWGQHFAGPSRLGPLHWSRDGKLMAGATLAGAVYLWDVTTGKRRGPFERPQGMRGQLVFTAGGRLLAWAQSGQAVHLWDVVSEKRLDPAGGHDTEIAAVAFGRGGREVLSLAEDGSVCTWDVVTGTERHRLKLREEDRLVPRTDQLPHALLSPDGRYALTRDRAAGSLWELRKGREVSLFTDEPSSSSLGAAFSPNGRLLAWVGVETPARTNVVRLYNVDSGQELRRFRGCEGDVRALAVRPDGQRVAVASDRNEDRLVVSEVRVWDAGTRKEVWRLTPPKRIVRGIAFSPDGRTLALADIDGGLTLHRGTTGHEFRRLTGGKLFRIDQLAFSPDGRTVAAGGCWRTKSGFDPKVVVWEVATGSVRQEFAGHDGALTSLAFSPDGRRLATGATDTTVLLWDLTGLVGQAKRGKPTAGELEDLWKALESNSGATGHAAMRRLRTAPGDAVALVTKHLKPAQSKPVDRAALERWVADLDHKHFARRDRAMRELEAAGKDAEPALRKVLDGKPSLELRRRVLQLLEKLEPKAPTADMVRPLRALEVLEALGTPEARKALETLASGAPGAWLTQEAKASLARLAARDKAP
jgi:WD40 repeat protein